MSQPHKVLVDAVLAAVQKRLGDDVRIFRRPVGLLFAADATPVRVGHAGQCDIWGYISGRGGAPGRGHFATPFEIECKYGRDKLRDDQESWLRLMERLHVPIIIVRADTRADIQTAAVGAADWVQSLQPRKGDGQ